MFFVAALPEFTTWLEGIKDIKIRTTIAARIDRLEQGLFGDTKTVGGGVLELRIHLGAGWRVYFTKRGEQVIILLAGGSKRTQAKDITRAKVLAAKLEELP
jgi:putative addiction module killer protein